MRRLRLAGMSGLAMLVVLVGGAAASHDASHSWTGTWRVSYPAARLAGTISFGLVASDVGRAAFVPLGVRPCPAPSDFYVGRLSRGRGEGFHVSCTNRTGAILSAAYRTDDEDRTGRFTVRVAEDRASFRGTYTNPGSPARLPLTGSFARHYQGDGAGSCPTLAPVTTGRAAPGDVRVVSFRPSAEFRPEGGRRWCPLTKATVLREGDDVRADPDGEVSLRLGRYAVTGYGATQFEIAKISTSSSVVKTSLSVAAGKVAVRTGQSGLRSELGLSSPTVASLRGTQFSLFHDPGSHATVVSARSSVDVDPAPSGLESVTLSARSEVEVSRSGITAVAPLGRAGTPKGAVGRSRALELAMTVVARNDERCEIEVTTFGLKRIPRGWRVSVRLAGRERGPAVWHVRGSRVSAVNALAKRVASGCPEHPEHPEPR
jgi:hypothetical protein